VTGCAGNKRTVRHLHALILGVRTKISILSDPHGYIAHGARPGITCPIIRKGDIRA